MENKNFKVLLVYANTPMEPLMPLGVASLATSLQNEKFTVKLFDTTLYELEPNYKDSQKSRINSLQIKAADYNSVGVKTITRNIEDDFKEMVMNFEPQLIGLSCVEITFSLGLRLLNSIKHLQIPIVVGGCYATFSPEVVISSDLIDMVCVGEGDLAIVKLAQKMVKKLVIDNIPNLWVKNKNLVKRPQKYELIDVQTLPIPKFEVFAPERIYRAMSGKIYRMIPVEISRGCPYHCTYCSAPFYAKKFSPYGKWLRFKTIDQIIAEIEYYRTNYAVEYFYFVSETFLALPQRHKEYFYERYRGIKIPFWFNTRPETINEKDINSLAEIGCHRISIGIESGNEKFRRSVLKRNYSNDTVLKAIRIISQTNIQLSVNNMIGFPDETRELIFDTIELNRKFNADSHGVSIFQPFRGTELTEYCISNNYFDHSKKCIESFSTSVINSPLLSNTEINGLYRTFNLYVTSDKSFWSEIKKAENDDEIYLKLVHGNSGNH